jgi:hypothetical protein
VPTRYRKTVRGWKDIANDFYTNNSQNVDLKSKFRKVTGDALILYMHTTTSITTNQPICIYMYPIISNQPPDMIAVDHEPSMSPS